MKPGEKDAQGPIGLVTGLSNDGRGVIRDAEGKVIFTPFALPGEKVRYEVIRSKKSYAFGRTQEVLSPSDQRVSPACRHFGDCGSCQLQHAAPELHKSWKKQWFEENCQRLGNWPTETLKTLSSTLQGHSLNPLHYRQRARLHFHSPTGLLGFQPDESSQNKEELVAVSQCPVMVPELEAALPQLQQALAQEFKDKSLALQVELTRHRTATGVSKIALTLFHSGRERRPVPTKRLNQVMSRLPSAIFENPGDDLLSIPSGSECFWIHREGFVQPHEQAPALYQKLVTQMLQNHELPAHAPAETLVWDLYGGCGLLSVPVLKFFGTNQHGPSLHLVENSAASLQAARKNLPPNTLAQVKCFFHQEGTLSFLQKKSLEASPNVLVADPPRSGLGKEVCDHIVDRARRNPHMCVILVFCDLAASARDVGLLLRSGLELQGAHVVDAFPQTRHAECLVHLSAKNLK